MIKWIVTDIYAKSPEKPQRGNILECRYKQAWIKMQFLFSSSSVIGLFLWLSLKFSERSAWYCLHSPAVRCCAFHSLILESVFYDYVGLGYHLHHMCSPQSHEKTWDWCVCNKVIFNFLLFFLWCDLYTNVFFCFFKHEDSPLNIPISGA